jgi:50S ribosomal subunit-associated GTPase HflX
MRYNAFASVEKMDEIREVKDLRRRHVWAVVVHGSLDPGKRRCLSREQRIKNLDRVHVILGVEVTVCGEALSLKEVLQ